MIIKDKNEFNEFINNEYVLVDFYADWCGPCKMLSPIVEQLENEISYIKVAKVNVDNLEDIARNYSVMSIPTLILFKNGNVIDKKIGFMSKDVILEWIEENK